LQGKNYKLLMVTHQPLSFYASAILNKKEDLTMNLIREMPRNYLSIRDLIDEYRGLHDKKAEQILELLIATKLFITSTSPNFQSLRNQYLDEKKLTALFQKTAAEFKKFSRHSRLFTSNEIDIFNFCRLAILERLELLQQNHDLIFDYYARQDEQLKAALKDKVQ